MCERDKTDDRPMDRRKSVPFDKLPQALSLGKVEEGGALQRGGLSRRDAQLSEAERERVRDASAGLGMKQRIPLSSKTAPESAVSLRFQWRAWLGSNQQPLPSEGRETGCFWTSRDFIYLWSLSNTVLRISTMFTPLLPHFGF